MQFAAKLISYTFHPIFMPAIGFVLVMGMGVEFVPFMSQEIKSKILFYLVLPFTVYFPLSYLILLRLSKNVSSFHLAIRKERIPLFIGTLIFYVAAFPRNLNINKFYQKLLTAEKPTEEGGMRPNQAIPAGVACTKCGREMSCEICEI